MSKNYDAMDIIDMVEEAVDESIRQDDTAEHDGAIYNMKANVFKHLAIADGMEKRRRSIRMVGKRIVKGARRRGR